MCTYGSSDVFLLSVAFGSCSVCDTLMRIYDYDLEAFPSEMQVADYMRLALYCIQELKRFPRNEIDIVDGHNYLVYRVAQFIENNGNLEPQKLAEALFAQGYLKERDE